MSIRITSSSGLKPILLLVCPLGSIAAGAQERDPADALIEDVRKSDGVAISVLLGEATASPACCGAPCRSAVLICFKESFSAERSR